MAELDAFRNALWDLIDETFDNYHTAENYDDGDEIEFDHHSVHYRLVVNVAKAERE